MPVKRRTKAKFQPRTYLTPSQFRRRELRIQQQLQFSPSSHFIPQFDMDTTPNTQGAVNNEAKKRKLHEAQLIPGLGPLQFGFPNSIITKLRYSEVTSINSTTGSLAKYAFSANSVFDPNFTGTGHQPLYYDNYAAIYDQYCVIGSKIHVTFIPRSTTLNCIVGITGDDEGTTATTFDTLCESNNTISGVCGPLGSEQTIFTMVFEPQEMFGVDAKSDGGSQTAVGSSPSEGWYWSIFSIPQDGTSTVAMDIKVYIEYTVKFAELKSQNQN